MASQVVDNASLANPVHQPQLDTHNTLLNVLSVENARQTLGSSSTASSSEAAMRKKNHQGARAKAYSSSSRQTQSSSSTRNDNAQKGVRTLPPWISSYEDDEDDRNHHSKPTDRLLRTPNRAHAAQHNHSPTQPPRRVSLDGYVDDYEEVPQGPNAKKPQTGGFFGNKEPVRGRKWDHVRDGDPVIMRANPATLSQWQVFASSTMYGTSRNEDGKRVDEEFLRAQTPGYDRPWKGDLDSANDPEKLSGILRNKKQRQSFIRRIQNILLMHPLVPLVFRLIVLATSFIALGISTSIHHLSNKYTYAQNPSTTMAIMVDTVAIPYIIYVTWDEYTGKPLGLRSPKAKIRLVLLDLFFIIFESANLALAFGALTDNNGSCQIGTNGSNFVICDRIRALCSILMIALIAWSLTFAVSIFRLVERVGGRDEVDKA